MPEHLPCDDRSTTVPQYCGKRGKEQQRPDHEDETDYKRLFAYDGSLLESYTGDDLPFDPKYGEPLCELKEFEPELNGNVLTVRLKGLDDTESVIRMTLRAGGAGE